MLNEKFDPFVAEWTSFVKNENHNLVEKCLKLAQILEYPELDISNYIKKLNDIGKALKLSITNVEVAKHFGLDLHITGFPSHVVVKYGEEMVLDPFDGGKLLSIDDLREILYESYGEAVEFLPEFLDDIESEQILVRIARNLKNAYVQSYAYDMAMRCIDMALALEPDSPEEIRDKGILEERLLHYDEALEFLNKYLEINPNAEDVDFVLELIKSIREKN